MSAPILKRRSLPDELEHILDNSTMDRATLLAHLEACVLTRCDEATAALRAEHDRLRAALEPMVEYMETPDDPGRRGQKLIDAARAALAAPAVEPKP